MSNLKQSNAVFFAIALLLTSIPFFVGWKAPASPAFAPQQDASGVDHSVWNSLLQTYVANGLVNYDGIQQDARFNQYLTQLSTCNPNALKSREEQLALACNAYNAFVINGVNKHRIRTTVDGFKSGGVGFFDIKEHVFARGTISLNDLEHKTIRPTFKDPRIHVALVCAARSCPAIRAEAYTGAKINQQLDEQSKLFANNPNYVRYDAGRRQLVLSKILSWYGDDWKTRYSGGYLEWLNGLVNDATLKQAITAARSGQLSVGFANYDWNLNIGTATNQQGSGTAVPTQGSGTAVPTQGSGTAVPTQGSGTAVPTQGSGTAVPVQGSGTAVPVQ